MYWSWFRDRSNPSGRPSLTEAYLISRPDFRASAKRSPSSWWWVPLMADCEEDLMMLWWIDSVLTKVMVNPFDASLTARRTEGIRWPWRGNGMNIA